MKIKSILSKLMCASLAVAMAVTAAACSSNDNSVPADGYQLPYEYSDGYKAKLNTTDDTEYVISSTDLIGNKVVHFTTLKSEDEVKKYYDDYFATLQEVKPKDDSDDVVGYYDKDKRLIMYNLIIWTADNKTNYKMGCEACDNLADSENWEAK